MARLKEYKKGLSIKLTKNFSSNEFDCKCKYPECNKTYIDLDHVEKLQKLRDKLRRKIKITSAYRCPNHNKDVGGVTNSRHVKGDATDIQVAGIKASTIADKAEALEFGGIGRYDSFTHLDSRTNKTARWDFRRKK